MNEHLNGPSSSPDFGHGAFDINSIGHKCYKYGYCSKSKCRFNL